MGREKEKEKKKWKEMASEFVFIVCNGGELVLLIPGSFVFKVGLSPAKQRCVLYMCVCV